MISCQDSNPLIHQHPPLHGQTGDAWSRSRFPDRSRCASYRGLEPEPGDITNGRAMGARHPLFGTARHPVSAERAPYSAAWASLSVTNEGRSPRTASPTRPSWASSLRAPLTQSDQGTGLPHHRDCPRSSARRQVGGRLSLQLQNPVSPGDDRRGNRLDTPPWFRLNTVRWMSPSTSKDETPPSTPLPAPVFSGLSELST